VGPDSLTIQMEITGKKHLWKEKDHGKMALGIGQGLSFMILANT